MSIEVREYGIADQPSVDKMMEGIAAEYDEAVTGPQSVRLPEAYQKPGHKYWVALMDQKVVGTVGVTLLSAHNAVLKRMMTDKGYRDPAFELANRLLRTAVTWARANGSETLYLGTMGQFVAAQRFYLKHGCEEIGLEALPSDFVVNTMDTIHYRLRLSQQL